MIVNHSGGTGLTIVLVGAVSANASATGHPRTPARAGTLSAAAPSSVRRENARVRR